jgi:beta-glucanase (GH16 family)
MIRAQRAVALVGLLALATAGVVAMAAEQPGTLGRLKLIFDDEFSGSRLDTAHWNTCYWWARQGCTIASNHELERYLPGQVQVGRGIAHLVAARRSARGSDDRLHPFVSGMISSGPPPGSSVPKFAFRFGVVEARMRVPAGAGLWSAFWLLPADRSDLPEIDAMEIFGQAPDVVEMHLHYRGRGGRAAVVGSSWRQPSLAAGWHRFEIDWRPGRLAWLVDGVVRWQLTGRAVPQSRMYLVADLAVGGDPVGAPTARTSFPSALRIDWVRVWQ